MTKLEVELISVEEFILDGLERLQVSLREKEAIEIDLKQMNPVRLLAFSACLTGYALDHFANREGAMKLFEEGLKLLAVIQAK
jgi:hypothetical protein